MLALVVNHTLPSINSPPARATPASVFLLLHLPCSFHLLCILPLLCSTLALDGTQLLCHLFCLHRPSKRSWSLPLFSRSSFLADYPLSLFESPSFWAFPSLFFSLKISRFPLKTGIINKKWEMPPNAPRHPSVILASPQTLPFPPVGWVSLRRFLARCRRRGFLCREEQGAMRGEGERALWGVRTASGNRKKKSREFLHFNFHDWVVYFLNFVSSWKTVPLDFGKKSDEVGVCS